ncbi:MAG TPA: Gfo/Idh/MocA family oxidoreductase [Roseiarcus sp.]|nr:Gfo/Idh/MocA family oxidoreductase [Roseiarcus sp.]
MPAIRWGLVGATVIGREWMIAAIREAGGEIVGVMSRDADRGRKYAEEFSIPKATTSLDALLPDADAVYIATTNERHKDECLAAARAGRHVLCEKPLATNLADARQMVEACRQAGVTLAVNHHLRNSAAHRAMRDLIAQGKIGKPLSARLVHGGSLPEHLRTWRLSNPSAGAGAVLDLTVHDADLLRFVLGDEPESVVSIAQNGGLAAAGVEDAAMSVVRFRSGLLASVYDSFTTPYLQTSLEIHGGGGSIIATDNMPQRPGGSLIVRTRSGEEKPALAFENYYVRGVRAFHNAIRGDGQPSATGEDGLRSLAVALAALQSAASGRAAPVEPGL